MKNVEKATAECASHYPVKVKLILSALGTPSLDYVLICDAVFEHTYLHLILSNYLSPTGVENLNKTSKSFPRFHHMLLRTEPNIVFKLFHHDPECASQTSIPIEYRLQFMFLVVMHKLHSPPIMRSLAGNWKTSFRCLDKVLKDCKDALPPELLAQLKRSLNHHHPTSSYATSPQKNAYRTVPVSTTTPSPKTLPK